MSNQSNQQYESPRARRQRLLKEWQAANPGMSPEQPKSKESYYVQRAKDAQEDKERRENGQQEPSTLSKVWSSIKESAEGAKARLSYEERAKRAAKERK